MRCTAPMNAPGPPPTIPSRKRRRCACVLAPLTMVSPCSGLNRVTKFVRQKRYGRCPASYAWCTAGAQARVLVLRKTQHAAIGLLVRAGAGEIVERRFRCFNDVPSDKGSAFAGALLGALDAAFPFEHGPATVTVLRELRENGLEIHLAIAERTETARAPNPGLKAAVNPLLASRAKFSVLYVKHFYARMIVVDVGEVVELLENKVARVIKNIAARMIADAVEKHFERFAVMEVFARMDLVTEIDPSRVESVEKRPPAFGELIEGSFNQSLRPLRPGIHVGPGERARKGGVCFQAKIRRRLRGPAKLLFRPGLACLGIATNAGSGKAVEGDIVSGMDRHKLALEVRGELGDLQFVTRRCGLQLLAVGFALGRALEIEQTGIPSGDLHTRIAESRGPDANRIETVERSHIRSKLSEENRRSLDGVHSCTASLRRESGPEMAGTPAKRRSGCTTKNVYSGSACNGFGRDLIQSGCPGSLRRVVDALELKRNGTGKNSAHAGT